MALGVRGAGDCVQFEGCRPDPAESAGFLLHPAAGGGPSGRFQPLPHAAGSIESHIVTPTVLSLMPAMSGNLNGRASLRPAGPSPRLTALGGGLNRSAQHRL